MTESQKSHNNSGWKGLSNIIQSNLLFVAGTTTKLKEVAQGLVPLNFEIFKIQTNLFEHRKKKKKNLWKIVAAPSHSHCETLFPCAQAEFLLLQLVTIASCPLSILYEIYIKLSRKHLINSAACFYFHQDIPDNFSYFSSYKFLHSTCVPVVLGF